MSGLDGELRRLHGRTMVFSEAVAIADGEITDGMLEIEFRLSSSGEEVFVEETVAAGSVFRIPKAGEVALLGFVDGDRNEGYVVGWIPKPDASPVPDIAPGTVYIWAPEGEQIRLVSNSRVTIEAPETRVGGDSATDPFSLSSKVDANTQAIKAILETHQHSYIAPLIPLAPAITTPGVPTQSPVTVQATGATKAKGE